MPDTAHLSPARRTVVRGACPHDCPDACALLVTVENGRAIEVRGASDHPPTGGVLCTKVAHYLERTYSDQRVLHPMKRVGRKGEGRFERISWDEALSTIAQKLAAIAASPDGPEAIVPYSYCGTMGLLQSGSMDRRFFHRLGASLLDRTICASAGKAGWAATIGASMGTDVEQFENSKLILIWGSNPIVSSLHFWTRAQEAKRRGAKLIAIDPYRSATAQKCHEHVALIPGTDAALALGMMHVLIAEDLLDHEYIAAHTQGFDALKGRAADYPPDRVAALCGIAADQVIQLARDYGTIRPAAIRLNYGMQRHAGGGNAIRAVACLPALVGSWRDPAGGALLSSSGTFPVDTAALERPDLIRGTPRTINMSTIGDALLEATDPPIRALFVYNSNPVAVAPESAKVVAGFARDDLFCVVHEIFQTDTADYADILLPATTQLEQIDVHNSYGHVYAMANNAAIAPLGEAKPNTEVFRLLAARMGFTEPCFADSDDDIARQAFNTAHPRAAGLDWDTMQARGFQRLSVPEIYAPFAHGNFPTASGKCEFHSPALAAAGHDPLPCFVPPRESVASNPALARRFPLAFISPPARNFLNSSFANLPRFVTEEGAPRLEIHPDDAAARDIVTGDQVLIANDRGSFALAARVTDRARRGVVVAPSVWWKKLSSDGGNANAVTSQALTDLGRAATFYDCLVEVAKIEADSSPAARMSRLLELAAKHSDVNARLARDHAVAAGAIARELGDEQRRGEALYWEGCALDHLLEHDAALAAFQHALAIAEVRADTAARGKLLRSIGFTYDELGDFPQALDHHLRALEIEDAAGNDPGRAATLRTIGVVYSRSGDAETGLDYFSRSLELCVEIGDDVGRAKTLNNIGVNLNDLGRHEESLASLHQALDLYQTLGLTLQRSGTLVNVGQTLEKLKRLAQAEATYHEALTLAEETGHMFGVVDALTSLGRLAAAQGHTLEARTRLESALAGAERHHLKQAACECHEALALLHEQSGEHEAALAHHRRFHALEREVLRQSSERQLKAVQTRYQLAAAQRDAEIHRLRQIELADANAELEQLNVTLRASDEQKTRLLEQLERLTYEDSLTGLGNRRMLDKRLEGEFDRAVRHGRPLTLVLLDVDHFKRVNDRFSHPVGDAALKELALLLSATVRNTDLVARFGGEEFVMLLVETDGEAAWQICEKVRGVVAAHDWQHVHAGLALTVSIGFCADTSMAGPARMLAIADRNLYRAKAGGRNRTVGDAGDIPALERQPAR